MKKIAVASGKGGTGKTTVSLLLTLIASKKYKVQLVDCDVENPNCHIFLGSFPIKKEKIGVFYPVINLEKCSFCKKCQEVCEYNCLLVLDDNVLFFPELCHPCKGCLFVCPEGAIDEGKREVGDICWFRESDNIYFNYAVMDVGEARANPLIEELKKNLENDVDLIIFDSPPGANCPMVQAVNDSDYVILVTEPTPFGLYDLKIAWSVVNKLGIPAGIVINRDEGEDKIITDFSSQENIPVILKIPFSLEFARLYSEGVIKADFFPDIEEKMFNIIESI
ncbi:ATP-binding protein [bacterium]|nr:ATP-binding protein [bacterium]